MSRRSRRADWPFSRPNSTQIVKICRKLKKSFINWSTHLAVMLKKIRNLTIWVGFHGLKQLIQLALSFETSPQWQRWQHRARFDTINPTQFVKPSQRLEQSDQVIKPTQYRILEKKKGNNSPIIFKSDRPAGNIWRWFPSIFPGRFMSELSQLWTGLVDWNQPLSKQADTLANSPGFDCWINGAMRTGLPAVSAVPQRRLERGNEWAEVIRAVAIRPRPAAVTFGVDKSSNRP